MVNDSSSGSDESRDMLFLAGGIALVVLGAGLLAAHPGIRKTVGAALTGILPELQGKFMPNLAGLGPDVQRYMKMRSM